MEMFCKSLENPEWNISILKLKGCGISDNIIKPFYEIIDNNNKIKELYLDNNDLNGENAVFLKNILVNNKYLHTFSLSFCRLNDEVKDLILRYIPQNQNIQNLNIEGNNFIFSESKKLDYNLAAIRLKESTILVSDVLSANKSKVNNGKS